MAASEALSWWLTNSGNPALSLLTISSPALAFLLLTVGPGIGNGRPGVGREHLQRSPVIRYEGSASLLVCNMDTCKVLFVMTDGYAQPGTGKRVGVPGVLGLRSLLAQGLEQVFLSALTLR